ncbi:MAG: helix-turn-helix domain-containing protein [Deltaproteobacteria bacterium]|nr:helix-turn-helix domain-containing protein [Deltaproteobacteria bacterium]
MSDSLKALVDTVQKLCLEKSISINKLAKLSGITQSTLDSILKGKSLNPTMTTLICLADALGVSVDFLLGRSESPKVHKPRKPQEG